MGITNEQSETQPADKKNDDYLNRYVRSPVFWLGYVALGILCGLFIYWAARFIPLRELLLGFGVALGLIIVAILSTAFLNRLKNQENSRDMFDKLDKLLASNNLHWIVNQLHIRNVEISSDETWTFATELTFALEKDTEIYNGIKRNLTRGARYKFFMPDRPKVHKIVADYKRLYKFEPGQVEFILIPASEFLFHTIISLYNVNTDQPRAIEWLPIRKVNSWVEMDAEHASKMAGIGEVLIRKYADRYTTPSSVNSPAIKAVDD